MTRNNSYCLRAGNAAHRLGFTLIELMVSLAIMALLAGLIMPSAVSALRRNDVESHGVKLMELLQFAQRYAVTSHHPVQVNIDREKNLCWASVLQTNLPWLEQEKQFNTRKLETILISKEYQLSMKSEETGSTSSSSWETITFKSDGRSDDTLVRLSSKEGVSFEIMVFGANGSIQQRRVTH